VNADAGGELERIVRELEERQARLEREELEPAEAIAVLEEISRLAREAAAELVRIGEEIEGRDDRPA
jgi:hypothetical protein